MRDIFVHLCGAAIDVQRSVARRGLLRTAKIGLLRTTSLTARDIFARLVPGKEAKQLSHPFDSLQGLEIGDVETGGLETGGLIAGRDLVTGHAHDRDNVGYYGIAPSVFREMCRRWLQTLAPPAEIESYAFVDLGAGKGRALLLASELNFREVIGIELNEGLAQIAQRNVGLWKRAGRARSDIRVLQQDVTDFSWPQTPLLLYLYNPFGRKVLERLLAQLDSAFARGSSPVDILYANPDCGFVLDQHPTFKRIWSHPIEMSDADKAADFYSLDRELVSAYRATYARTTLRVHA